MKTKFILLFLGAIIVFSSFQLAHSVEPEEIRKGMVKITIMYPNAEGKTFDMDYYSSKHMPMAASLFGDAMKHMSIDKGVAAGRPGEPLPYLAIGYFYFDTLEEYQEVFGPNAEKILGDIPNYTNIQPVVQISEVIQ